MPRTRLGVGAALLLIVLGIPWTLLGLVGSAFAIAEAGRTCAPDAPICRNFELFGVALAVVWLPAGLVHLIAGVGTLRGSRKALALGWIVAAVGTLLSAYVALSALTPIGWVLSDSGLHVPLYDPLSLLIASSLIAYVALLLLLWMRRSRRSSATSSPSDNALPRP